ncbi:hypothetical protein ONZ45_g6813 [Pleurotus djamor]|nr:hypothetical protein ONZ45_g6813 [Pleurotus djamor]
MEHPTNVDSQVIHGANGNSLMAAVQQVLQDTTHTQWLVETRQLSLDHLSDFLNTVTHHLRSVSQPFGIDVPVERNTYQANIQSVQHTERRGVLNSGGFDSESMPALSSPLSSSPAIVASRNSPLIPPSVMVEYLPSSLPKNLVPIERNPSSPDQPSSAILSSPTNSPSDTFSPMQGIYVHPVTPDFYFQPPSHQHETCWRDDQSVFPASQASFIFHRDNTATPEPSSSYAISNAPPFEAQGEHVERYIEDNHTAVPVALWALDSVPSIPETEWEGELSSNAAMPIN